MFGNKCSDKKKGEKSDNSNKENKYLNNKSERLFAKICDNM